MLVRTEDGPPQAEKVGLGWLGDVAPHRNACTLGCSAALFRCRMVCNNTLNFSSPLKCYDGRRA